MGLLVHWEYLVRGADQIRARLGHESMDIQHNRGYVVKNPPQEDPIDL